MATSGTVTFRSTRDQIIEDAVTKCNGADPENTTVLTSAQTTKAARHLNMLIGHYKTKGLSLFKRKLGVLFPQYDKAVFALGSPSAGGDHATLATPLGAGGFVHTTLTSAASSGASSIVVDSVSSPSTAGISAVSITNAYNIGVELDDGTIHWTTVNGAPSGTTVTLTATLTDDAASGNTVYCYQTKLVRPLRILDAWVGDNVEKASPVKVISRQEYMRFGDRGAVGTPTQCYYDPQINTGHLYIYPRFQSMDKQLYFEFESPIEDFASASDDFDLPQEWNLTLVFNLAMILAPDYTCPPAVFKQIQSLAKYYEDQVTAWDQEVGSMFIQPDSQRG